MTKEGYTHIIVPKDLREILKREAKARDMSISQYITEILSQIQSIKGLVSDDSGINTLKKKEESSKLNISGLDAIRTHDLRLVKAASSPARPRALFNILSHKYYN